MPTVQIGTTLGYRDLHPAGQIDQHHRRDIGNGVASARDELAFREPCVDVVKEMPKPRTPALREFGDLRVVVRTGQRTALQALGNIAERIHGGEEAIALDL